MVDWSWDPADIAGGVVAEGGTGRITDPASGAGLFNPNLDPAVVGQDEDGTPYATGTDMSFGAPIRRQMHTNVVNGDFATLPPEGADSVIVSDPSDASYNPLPGWTLTDTPGGLLACTVTASGSAASGYVLHMVAATNAGLDIGDVSQLVPIPRSQGQQYRVLLSAFAAVTGGLSSLALTYQFYQADGTTAIGSLAWRTLNKASSEFKLDAGLVPTNATYIRVAIACGLGSTAATADVYEVRAAFLPAEAEVGLKAITANTGAITNSEAIVVDATIPAGTFTVGSVYRIRAYGTCTSSAANAVTFRVRIGTSSLSGNIVASVAPTATTTASANGFELDGLITIRSVGASGSAIGGLTARGTGPGTQQPFTDSSRVGTSTATVAVDTTVANTLELTAVTAAGTTSVNLYVATIECVMAS